MLHAFFWVITRRLEFICRRFGTLCLFHLHSQVDLPAYEDGTECSETSAYKLQTPGYCPKESIQHTEHGESLKSRTHHLYREETARHIRLFEKLRIKKTNSSPPLLSSFAAEITTPNLVSYSSITTSTPALPTESNNGPVLPYSGKGYITTDENLITHHENC